MKRNIVSIDEEKCTGCGLCADACQEGAIVMIDGKAKLVRDDYCDGLGHCLPACPADAIRIIVREADPFDEEAVKEIQAANSRPAAQETTSYACPGTASQTFDSTSTAPSHQADLPPSSQLAHWPVQLQLAPVKAPYFDKANLLVAADCAAYAHLNFHNRFMKNHVTLIGCPKLDPVDYSQKLLEILRQNAIKPLTIVRMEVPCCGGLERAAVKALQDSGKFIPWQVITLNLKGDIIED